MIKKILVANRGEIALRIFRTCRVMNIATVAIYTRVDRGALHVRYAEEAYCISDSPEDTSYLKPEKILQIAKKTGAAIHPGYGFLSENADFARRCEEEGVIFIGPSADIIARMGIKTAVYIEKYIENPHHIEVQILGDKYGNVIHLYERECSIQRRNQKVIEESPSPFVKPETRAKMLKVAVEACKRINYYSAGTLEFMMDKDQNFYFLEMNTRLQVEHPVTEECTGVDLVRDMILVAAGNRLPYRQEDVEFRGAAIECRIYAEDPENNFMPSPGVITVREAPEGRNVRLDSAAYAGFEVSLHYDPMIAKLCCWGRNRDSAISNMARALREYKILGIKTTIPFHQRVLKNAAFLKGEYDTTFIDTRFDKEDLKRRQNTDPTVAVIAAALKHYEEEKEAASRATTLPVVGDSLWKYYGKLQMTANNY